MVPMTTASASTVRATGLYRRLQNESRANAADPIELVTMLYDELETAVGVLAAMVRQGQRVSATEPAHRARVHIRPQLRQRQAHPHRRAHGYSPPPTVTTSPCMYGTSSDSSHATVAAISSGCAYRPSGTAVLSAGAPRPPRLDGVHQPIQPRADHHGALLDAVEVARHALAGGGHRRVQGLHGRLDPGRVLRERVLHRDDDAESEISVHVRLRSFSSRSKASCRSSASTNSRRTESGSARVSEKPQWSPP